MSLGRFLKRSIEGKESLVDVIDKELKNRPVFNAEILSEVASRFSKCVNDDETSGDKFRKSFMDLWKAVSAEPPRRGKVIHPSSLMDECERKLFYEFSDVEPTESVKRKIDGRVQRIFDLGTWVHIYIQTLLYSAGVLLEAEVPVRDRKRRIRGHADGIILWLKKRMLLEIKTTNAMMFAKAKLYPFEKHQHQASIYAKVLGLDTICYLYFNKDTSDIHIHILPINEKYATLGFEKIDFVMESVKTEVSPKRTCKTIESPNAKNCPFKSHCFKSH